jgi:hypothetical protein
VILSGALIIQPKSMFGLMNKTKKALPPRKSRAAMEDPLGLTGGEEPEIALSPQTIRNGAPLSPDGSWTGNPVDEVGADMAGGLFGEEVRARSFLEKITSAADVTIEGGSAAGSGGAQRQEAVVQGMDVSPEPKEKKFGEGEPRSG